ncbi:MAG: cell envelope biogenesis protein OmpA [Flavobacteriales bacterium]
MQTSRDKLDVLRDLLLIEDREDVKKILDRLDQVEQDAVKKQLLEEQVSPYINKSLHHFSETIPEKLGPTITKTLEKQIKESQDKVAETLYPVLGKMIKKYIQNEIKLLSESINNRIKTTFPFKRKITSFFSGTKESDLLISELVQAKILQVFVIEKNSGILLGSYSKEETIDQEMISGMLTAIKNFVEDAFEQNQQNLETIEYELYNIHIQNFHTYYIATIISGVLTEKNKNNIENGMIHVASQINLLPSLKDNIKINNLLASYLKNENI